MVTVADFGIYYQMESWGHLYLSKFEFQGARLTGCHTPMIYPFDIPLDYAFSAKDHSYYRSFLCKVKLRIG